MRSGERLFRLALRLTPRAFRERYADEMLATHRLRMNDVRGGWLVRQAVMVRETRGVLWVALRLRARAWRSATPSAAPDARRPRILDGIAQDIRFAVRTLRRSPAYTAAAVVVLALGIGAGTAIFSALNAFFFRPLPFAEEDRLVMLYETNPEFGWTDASAAPANVLDWREQMSAFADVAAWSDFVDGTTYVADGEPVLLAASAVTGNFFDVLGVRPALGRGFRWEETWETGQPVAVLSHRLWVTHFGADPDVVGGVYDLGGNRVEVVGVMPEGFSFPSSDTELWYPWAWPAENREAVWFRRAHFVRPIARLAPGVTHEQAAAELELVVQRLQTSFPETNSVMGAGMMPARDFLIRQVRRPLLILFGAVALLLLLACANVANLTLVRGAERGREMALRHALGAGRLRVARQLLTENLLLAVAAGIIGIALGWAGVRAMAALTTLGIDGATSIALDVRVILFTLSATLASGMLFGLIPAIRSTGERISGTLIDGGTGASSGAGLRTVRTLVIAEVTLALLLVMGAGLMTRSFLLMRDVDPGFSTDGVLAVEVSIPSARYASRDEVLAFQDRLIEALESRPGIDRAGIIGQLPLAGPSWSSQFQAAGWPAERVGFEILHRRADAGYFAALDIPLVRGRMFEPRDRTSAVPVVLINETFAAEHFPGEDPIGQRIAYDRAPDESSIWYEVIGIVGDQNQVSPGVPARAEAFENRHQDWARTNWVVVRTAADPMSMMPTVRSVLSELDPLIPIAEARPLREVWRASMAREEFILTLLTIFGVVALLLAIVGVYAVTAQAARRRTREIGIRMALGAGAGDVIMLMLGRSLAMVGTGVVIGLALSLVANRALASMLYGVSPGDPLTAAGVVLILSVGAGIACYLPVRRATAVDPVRTLRQE
ncbi:MAG TPA: ABC transporter permease [Longimicrobiales bacterium]|nr:ABC transporter permease [Longimicrobiales bacterium]